MGHAFLMGDYGPGFARLSRLRLRFRNLICVRILQVRNGIWCVWSVSTYGK